MRRIDKIAKGAKRAFGFEEKQFFDLLAGLSADFKESRKFRLAGTGKKDLRRERPSAAGGFAGRLASKKACVGAVCQLGRFSGFWKFWRINKPSETAYYRLSAVFADEKECRRIFFKALLLAETLAMRLQMAMARERSQKPKMGKS